MWGSYQTESFHLLILRPAVIFPYAEICTTEYSYCVENIEEPRVVQMQSTFHLSIFIYWGTI